MKASTNPLPSLSYGAKSTLASAAFVARAPGVLAGSGGAAGVLLGPYGLGLVSDVGAVETLAEVGVVRLVGVVGVAASPLGGGPCTKC